jgi:hypothetical protein
MQTVKKKKIKKNHTEHITEVGFEILTVVDVFYLLLPLPASCWFLASLIV